MKREPQDFEVQQGRWTAALERRKAAERAIIAQARALESLPPGAERVDAFCQTMESVRAYNHAEAELRSAQEALDERARKR